jgi:hypothetical protein
VTVAARGGGGRDAEAGAAERRLAEALRAQASLGARSAPAAPAAPVATPATPKRGGQRAAHKPSGHNPVPKGPAPKGGPAAHAPPTSAPAAGTPARGQSGPARGVQSGPQHAAPRPAGAHLAPPAGRSAGRPARPRDDQLPTTKVVTAEPGAAGAPTTQHPVAVSPADRPAPLAPALMAGRALLDARLRLALLVGLLAGVLLGCVLALLSVVDPGLLPAIG